MRIYCLSSYTKRGFEPPQMRQEQFDFFSPQLNGCQKYVFTEIFVGRRDVNFEFHVFREDFGWFRYLMDGDVLEARREGNDYIDVKIAINNGFGLQVFVKSIRLRCVKADSTRKLTKEQKNYFKNYAAKIEEYANGDPERRETAFNVPEIEPFKLANAQQDNNRMSDLMNAFNGLCHQGTKRISDRFNQSVDPNININLHKDNDHRINIIKDFSQTKQIKLYRSKLTKIIPKWFEATNLEIIDLNSVYPFDFDEAGQWKIFAQGIKNCQKMKQLTFHDCGIEEIPDSVFQALPESLEMLSLGDNNIKAIPPSIERLKNLYSLSVSYNPELSDAGFPWKNLPQNLHMLDLASTGLTQIPAAIERLNKLEHLIVGKCVQYIKWKCLPQSLEDLQIDADGQLNPPRSMQRFYLFRQLALRNAGLKQRFFKHLSSIFWLSYIDLSNNNFKTFKCPNIAQNVTRLSLNNCKLSKIIWSDIWRCMPSLRKLELRNNNITEVEFFVPEYYGMELTQLDLEGNKISKIDGNLLPDSLTHLNLSDNKIVEFENIDLLDQLSYLWIDDNELKELPSGIERCRRLLLLSASKNHISSLPHGFENMDDMLMLDISDNEFVSNDDLDSCLWDRLPGTIGLLKLSNNNLGELPCQLSKRAIWKLEAIGCNLRYICPRIGYTEYEPGSKNYLIIKQNPELECLSFVPTKIYAVPKAQEKKEESTDASKGRLILWTDRSFRDTTRWHTKYKIHNYDFTTKETANEEPHKCRCCARCGVDCIGENGIIETYMVMDFTQIVETPASEAPNKKDLIDEFGPGEWKTLIKTKMCKKCIDEIKLEVLMFYDDMPLEHKIREKDNEIAHSGADTVANKDAAPNSAQLFTIPYPFDSNMPTPVIGPPASQQSHFPEQQLIQYTDFDGTISYEEPQQQQMNYFDETFIYQEVGAATCHNPPYYPQTIPMEISQHFDNTIFTQQANTVENSMDITYDNSYYQTPGHQFNAHHGQRIPTNLPNIEQIYPQGNQPITHNYLFTNEMNDEEFESHAKRL